MNASEFLEQLERDREALFARSPRRRPARVVPMPAPPRLDRLTPAESRAYETGAWLGPAVRSVDLTVDASSSVAELSARIRVQLERQEAG